MWLEVAFSEFRTMLLKALVCSLLFKEKMKALGVLPYFFSSLSPETAKMGPSEFSAFTFQRITPSWTRKKKEANKNETSKETKT